jgi:hypothetical protein
MSSELSSQFVIYGGMLINWRNRNKAINPLFADVLFRN